MELNFSPFLLYIEMICYFCGNTWIIQIFTPRGMEVIVPIVMAKYEIKDGLGIIPNGVTQVFCKELLKHLM